MPTKRDLLAHLTRDELLAVVDRFALVAPDRRARESLIEAVASSKKATLAEILPASSRDRLKELCRALGLDDGGKEKAPIVERLLGGKAPGEPSATIRAPKLRDISGFMLFDRVIANPLFSLDDWGARNCRNDPYSRFGFGIPPREKGARVRAAHDRHDQ